MQPVDEFNQQLLAAVHPPHWQNPIPHGRYNFVVIGAGTAGLVAAAGAAGLGAKVALIERHLMGGDCLNFGCVPSKALLRSGRAAVEVRDAAQFGVRVPMGAEVDFAAVMQRMRTLRANMSQQDSAERFQSLGVDVFLGAGEFVAPDAIRVGAATLQFRKALIATGGRAAVPDVPGLAEAGFLTNETVFSLTERPSRLAVLGGGPIGCELAQAFARFGSEVTLLHRGARLMPRDDGDAGPIITRALEQDGVRVVCQAQVVQVIGDAAPKRIEFEAAGLKQTLDVDAILVATGRTPNVRGLGLAAAGIAFDEARGIVVDDFLRTTNRRVFAAGDCCSPHRFTHVADFQARAVIQNAFFFGRARASRMTIPWCTFTDPEVAHVGLTVNEATVCGTSIQTFTQPLAQVDRAILDGQTDGFVRIHVRAGTDRIVGATVVAAHAGDLISEISVAMAGRVGLKRLASVIHPYPTQADAIRKLGDAFQRTRLTPTVQAILRRWFAWTR